MTTTRPAYLLSLEIENVRCFGPKQTLDLSREDRRPAQWTLILGDNGMGKTTLLQLISDFRVQSVPETTDALTLRRRGERGRLLIKSGQTFACAAADYVSGSLLSTAGEAIQSRRSCWIHPDGLETGSEEDFRKGYLGDFFLLGYGASRRISRSELKVSEESDPTATLFDPDAGLLNAEELLLRLDYRALQGQRKGRAQERLEQVTAMICDLLPDVSDVVVRPADENGSVRSGLEDSIRFQTPYGEVPLRSLSLGYQTMLAWTVDLASRMLDRYPSSPNPLHEHAVVLVDEIDLHLHPRWQRQILDFLSQRFPNVQFIATAHSPLVVQAAGEAGVNLVVLRREGDHVVIDNNPQVVEGWRVDQVLSSDLFAGVDGSRGPKTEQKLQRRRDLLMKAKRTSEEDVELAELSAWQDRLPTASNPEDQRAMDVIRRTAALLEKKGL